MAGTHTTNGITFQETGDANSDIISYGFELMKARTLLAATLKGTPQYEKTRKLIAAIVKRQGELNVIIKKEEKVSKNKKIIDDALKNIKKYESEARDASDRQDKEAYEAAVNSANVAREAITNAGGVQRDFVWIKHRSSAENHNLYDGIRGPGNRLESNANAPDFYYSDRLTAFNSNGFNLGTGYNNTNGTTYVGWQWRGSSANATNSNGSVTSIVRANPTAGFSVVTYTATAADPITVGHGLGVAPSMFMVKSRSASGTDWFVYHGSLGATKNLRLNTTAAAATATNVWNDTAPTSSVITTSNAINTNGVTYVAYCFAEIAGYSKFGSYTGNGSTDGPFVYTGFRPKFVITKRTDNSSGGNWTIIDGARNPYNVTNLRMYADTSDADGAGNIVHDFVSNGFKVRQGDSSTNNISGATYIYMAFAEAPFKYARSR
jgi:hypothetical protein